MARKTDGKESPLQQDVSIALLLRMAAQSDISKLLAQSALLNQSGHVSTHKLLAMEKRRLESVARGLGISRKTAIELVRAYLGAPREN